MTAGTLRLRVAHTGTAWKVAIFHTGTGIEAEIAYLDTYAAAAAKSRDLLDATRTTGVLFGSRVPAKPPAPRHPIVTEADKERLRQGARSLQRKWLQELNSLAREAATVPPVREEVPEC